MNKEQKKQTTAIATGMTAAFALYLFIEYSTLGKGLLALILLCLMINAAVKILGWLLG